MWWNDIKEMKEWMTSISARMTDLQMKMDDIIQGHEDRGSIRQAVDDSLDEIFCSEEEHNTINRIHDKLNSLLNDEKRKDEVELATKTLDKFEDYMKNVHKLNEMVNEFKGCVSMSRGAIGEGRALTSAIQQVQHIANISETIYKAMEAFILAADKIEHKSHFKIDYIYKKVEEIADFMQKQEKKSRKRTKRKAKKRAASQGLLSE